MLAEWGVYGLSMAAGILSTLSPCVLPLVPILVGTALTAHRRCEAGSRVVPRSDRAGRFPAAFFA
jgi:cytochrome c biogenesis protein CcdA